MAHGRDYLTGSELDLCVKRQLSEYYRYLGKCLFARRDVRFWRWHQRALKEAGLTFSRLRVLGGAAAEGLDAALNPKHALDRVRTAGARRRGMRGSWSEKAAASVEHTVV